MQNPRIMQYSLLRFKKGVKFLTNNQRALFHTEDLKFPGKKVQFISLMNLYKFLCIPIYDEKLHLTLDGIQRNLEEKIKPKAIACVVIVDEIKKFKEL